MAGDKLNARKKRVFDSVFSRPSLSQPTPVATPATGFTAPSQIFGGPLPFTHDRHQASFSDIRGSQHVRGIPACESDHVRDQVLWDRSWHTVTYALSLPDISAHSDPLELLKGGLSTDAGFDEALRDLLAPQNRLPFASHTEDILIWHTNQVRHHFLQQILPILLNMGDHHAPETVLFKSIKILEGAHRLYLDRIAVIIRQMQTSVHGDSPNFLQNFRRDLHAIISNSVTGKLTACLKYVLKRDVSTILGLPSNKDQGSFVIKPEPYATEEARHELLGLVKSLQNVGLGGERFQITFAEIMNESMTDYVYCGCKGLWSPEYPESQQGAVDQPVSEREKSILPRTAHHHSPSRCVTDLCQWIENRYAKLAVQVFEILDSVKVNGVKVTWSQVEKWKEMSIGHLATLRISELFDIVVNWPHSSGALDDLRAAITTPQRRLNLTDVFASTLNERLLHPGASTLQILQTYISMICSFHALDHSKVLLDRVAYPLQLYLCSREDTVRIIITGLLSDTEDEQGSPIGPGGNKLVELALLLNKGSEQLGQRTNDEELDWSDMDWVPDPVDAGPGYKRSKNADIIGTLIGVLGSQDVFIKEFQNIIGENLLKHDGGFEKEIKVLELLKVRFGEAPLQSCEVMLKDIQDSGRVNGVIRRNQKLDPSEQEIEAARASNDMLEGVEINPEGMLKPSLHAKILSRLFWPQLHDDLYRIPDDITELQRRYEQGFESLKASRKLTWLHTLGQATVELELTDRTIVEEVHTWQATVIWAFQSHEPGDTTVTRSVQELIQHLEMDEALVRAALKFWMNKLVLQEISTDVFSVLEVLNQEDRARSNAQAAAGPLKSTDDTSLMTNDGITTEKMQMYWQFIQGMLTNSSSQMPLQQIAMMLKMLIVDGFPYSNEELQEFLGWKVTTGELELAGGKYRLKKA